MSPVTRLTWPRGEWITLLERRAKLQPGDAQADSELPELAVADVALGALDGADEPPVQLRLVCKALLGITGRFAQAAHGVGERLEICLAPNRVRRAHLAEHLVDLTAKECREGLAESARPFPFASHNQHEVVV
jgi:hypothetical protein